MSGQVYTANTSFSIVWEGSPLVVEAGSTAREGHPLLVAYPHFFDLLKPSFEYTPPKAPAAPARPAPEAKKPAAPTAKILPAPATPAKKVD
jgi:hypothetical protein